MKIRLFTVLSLLVVSVCISATAHATEDTEAIESLLHQNKLSQALSQAETLSARNPEMPLPRFLKGVILARLNRKDEAIAVFSKLTQDFPSLPEPYNNLAALYTQKGDYSKAQEALETALQTHPNYSVVHRNLSEVYARTARQAYVKALQLEGEKKNNLISAEPPIELAIIDTLSPIGLLEPLSDPINVAVAPKSVPAPSHTVSMERPSNPPAQETKPKVAVPPPVEVSDTASKITPSATTPAVPETESNAAAATSNEADQNEITQMVQKWAQAWSKKDVKAYLGFYDKSFIPPAGHATRASWEQERRSRLNRSGTINVTLENIQVNVKGNQATVRFRQYYRANSLNRSTYKTLELIRNKDQWLIKSEQV